MTAVPANFRRARRVAFALVGLGVMFGSSTLFGWRYGFTRLPQPVSGVDVSAVAPPTWLEAGTNNSWCWVRRISLRRESGSTGRSLEDAYLSTVDAWARSGAQPSAGFSDFVASLRTNDSLGKSFHGFLRAGENRPPEAFTASDVRVARLLSVLPLLRAAQAEQQGRASTACEHLLEAWEFQARLLAAPAVAAHLLDERGPDQLNETIGRPWRRLVLDGPPISPENATRWLASLATVTNALPPLTGIYRRLAAEAVARNNGHWPPPLDWRRIRLASVQAMSLMTQDAFATFGVVFSALVADTQPWAQLEGLGHLRRPARMLLRGWQDRAVRWSDVKAATESALSQALASLDDASSSNELTETAAGRVPTWFQASFDRPAVWRAVAELPDPGEVLMARQLWLAYLESCRLTLALKVYRDQHGCWPERLAELSPGILPALPRYPFTQFPWCYERTGSGWKILAPRDRGPASGAPSRRGESFAFGSNEP